MKPKRTKVYIKLLLMLYRVELLKLDTVGYKLVLQCLFKKKAIMQSIKRQGTTNK